MPDSKGSGIENNRIFKNANFYKRNLVYHDMAGRHRHCSGNTLRAVNPSAWLRLKMVVAVRPRVDDIYIFCLMTR